MRVGTSLRRLTAPLGVWDHPHACGDKPSSTKPFGYKIGSSPCVWGQAVPLLVPIWQARIIPMRVGTSIVAHKKAKVNRDHPHACGDKFFYCLSVFCCIGSSPCVWGQADFDGEKYTIGGIIPMRVGTRIFSVCLIDWL